MIKITKPKIEDVKGIANVTVKTWQHAYRGLINEDYLKNLSIKKRTDSFKKQLSSDSSDFICFIAKKNDKIVGLIWGGKNREQNSKYDAEIYGYYILPKYHGKGIGRKLFSAFAAEALKLGMKNMSLWCLHGNDTAKIYVHFGGKYIKSKMVEIPKNSGQEYQEDMYAFAQLKRLVKI